MSRLAKGLLGTSLLGLFVQAVVLTGADHRLNASLASNVLGICLAILATSSTLAAASIPDGYARSFWRLLAAGFALLTAAEVVGTYYDCVLHADIHSVWPSDILYFFVPAPMALALFLRRRWRGIDGFHWAQCFDFLQIAILSAAAYLYYFYLPSHWRASKLEMEQLQWTVTIASDAFLLVAFAFRLTSVRSKLEWSLLLRLGVFLCFFCLGSVLFLHQQISSGLDSGTLWDLSYTAPLVVAIALACTWKLQAHPAPRDEGQTVRLESWGSLWMSVLLPLVILGVASRLVHERPLLATIVVVVTLAASGSRSRGRVQPKVCLNSRNVCSMSKRRRNVCQSRSMSAGVASTCDHHSHTGLGIAPLGSWVTSRRMTVPSMIGRPLPPCQAARLVSRGCSRSQLEMVAGP